MRLKPAVSWTADNTSAIPARGLIAPADLRTDTRVLVSAAYFASPRRLRKARSPPDRATRVPLAARRQTRRGQNCSLKGPRSSALGASLLRAVPSEGSPDEREQVAQANEWRAARRGYFVFATDPARAPDEPGYRAVFATEAGTKAEAMARVRPLAGSRRLRAFLATGGYRDELADAQWVP